MNYNFSHKGTRKGTKSPCPPQAFICPKDAFDVVLRYECKPLDVSEFSHLYQSKDPHFYDNIPEYEMLKRGMTEEERIKNGYWVAYRIAEVLEEKVKEA